MRACGKLLRLGSDPWYIKGLTYGPFEANDSGYPFPKRPQLQLDLSHMARLGANALRLYHLPTPEFLDDALASGLRVLIDVPWEKHRCFFEDWATQREALRRVTGAAAELGNHPAVFGISVANEIPKDVVRFYGARRVERFIDSLLDAVKQQAPDCLATYTNYPSTEFLTPTRLDFYCTNVYLEDSRVLGDYLDRLQHVAGCLPLVLGEYGVDSLGTSRERQADLLAQHVRRVFHHGLAGSFVFSYTDDWFTAGHRVVDWAFGITDAVRVEKPAAKELSRVWALVPRMAEDPNIASAATGEVSAPDSGSDAIEPLPRVSVVVCSYNGGATLGECLGSLLRLDYPDYEVILVDDGSTDDTPRIAAGFPQVKTIRQENGGLSVARNVGARAATGQVIAYTDSDCVADETWLLYLVRAMREQGVDAIGGPNVPPTSDGWVARCVAASPGGPSHVMLDDRHAEHVPGCNMAFRRDRLEAVGGFDPRFRQAGDDVDICWRYIDAGLTIGYAPSALVWHHRRTSVAAYCRQQKGYGRSEAMLSFKHPRRFNALGCSLWNGIIYGDGGARALGASTVYHGRFGSGLFQIVYRRNEPGWWTYCTLLEWHALAVLFLTLTPVFPACAVPAALMWLSSLLAVSRAGARAALPPGVRWWCRPLIAALHLIQPPVRAWYRYAYRVRHARPPGLDVPPGLDAGPPKRITRREFDLYAHSGAGRGREELLDALVDIAGRAEWPGDFHSEWQQHDVELWGTLWHKIRLRTASEELGRGRRFTRVRCSLLPTTGTFTLCGVLVVWTLAVVCWTWCLPGERLAGLAHLPLSSLWPAVMLAGLWSGFAAVVARSGRRCRKAVGELVRTAALTAGLELVEPRAPSHVRTVTDSELPALTPDDTDSDGVAGVQMA